MILKDDTYQVIAKQINDEISRLEDANNVLRKEFEFFQSIVADIAIQRDKFQEALESIVESHPAEDAMRDTARDALARIKG